MGLRRIRAEFQNNDFEFVTDVVFQVEAFRTYIEMTQSTIENDIKNGIARYVKIMNEEKEVYLELGYDFSEMEILEHTSNLYYSSIHISISSFLERKMYQLCRIAEKLFVTKINTIREKGIYRYHKYLTTIVGLDLTEINNEWSVVVSKARFRNKLVHETENTKNISTSLHLTVPALLDYLLVIEKILNYIVYEPENQNRP